MVTTCLPDAQALGVIGCACIMMVASLEVIQLSATDLVHGFQGTMSKPWPNSSYRSLDPYPRSGQLQLLSCSLMSSTASRVLLNPAQTRVLETGSHGCSRTRL